PFLPRVTSGRLVLCRARWALSAAEVAALDAAGDADRYAAVQAWRRRRRVPRWVVLPEGDNELAVDLDNALAVDAFLALVRGRPAAQVTELYPGPEELCAESPEGRFTHEVVVPFVRRREPTHWRPRPPVVVTPGVERGFPPGSEWLTAKLYTGTATADRVLRQVVPRVVPPALASGAADGWFFLRYGDPDWHLRLRLHGPPERLCAETLPALREAVAPLLADGQVWKMELATYEREVERYGGPVGVVLAERVFQADSEAAVAVLDLLEGDGSADVAWRLALAGIDRLLADLGLDDDAALAVLESMQASFAREHRADGRLKKQMSDRLRGEQADLERLLAAGDDPAHPFAPALAVLARRSRALAPIVAELSAEIAAGRVGLSMAELAPSFAHMSVNRLLRSNPRAHELVLYDLLLRLAQGRRMRRRALAAVEARRASGGAR
ncbi:MAG TPA: thiopeptide-type bacteriocin biosynthesis protein, partial [Thermoanaerobaculia bacterium]